MHIYFINFYLFISQCCINHTSSFSAYICTFPKQFPVALTFKLPLKPPTSLNSVFFFYFVCLAFKIDLSVL